MKQITNIRKAVCSMANELKKAGYSLSEAFKKAWRRRLFGLCLPGKAVHYGKIAAGSKEAPGRGTGKAFYCRLGHSSLAMTMDLYSHVLPNTKQKEMDNLKIVL